MMVSGSKIFLANNDDRVDLEEIVEKKIQHKCSLELVERCSKRVFPIIKLPMEKLLISFVFVNVDVGVSQ
jgi:hypothetical protein